MGARCLQKGPSFIWHGWGRGSKKGFFFVSVLGATFFPSFGPWGGYGWWVNGPWGGPMLLAGGWAGRKGWGTGLMVMGIGTKAMAHSSGLYSRVNGSFFLAAGGVLSQEGMVPQGPLGPNSPVFSSHRPMSARQKALGNQTTWGGGGT